MVAGGGETGGPTQRYLRAHCFTVASRSPTSCRHLITPRTHVAYGARADGRPHARKAKPGCGEDAFLRRRITRCGKTYKTKHHNGTTPIGSDIRREGLRWRHLGSQNSLKTLVRGGWHIKLPLAWLPPFLSLSSAFRSVDSPVRTPAANNYRFRHHGRRAWLTPHTVRRSRQPCVRSQLLFSSACLTPAWHALTHRRTRAARLPIPGAPCLYSATYRPHFAAWTFSALAWNAFVMNDRTPAVAVRDR